MDYTIINNRHTHQNTHNFNVNKMFDINIQIKCNYNQSNSTQKYYVKAFKNNID